MQSLTENTESTEGVHEQMRRVAVVGGGISGLSLALELKRSGNEVILFEATERPGGKIGTMYKDGFELDLGPITCSETPALRELIASLNLENDVVTASAASSVRYIYSQESLRRVEPGPLKIMTSSLLSVKGKIAFWKFPFSWRDDREESAASFARRRFGEEAYQKLFNPILNGIYAGDAEKLSARSTLKGMNNRRTRKIISLLGGFGKLTDTIRRDLKESALMNSTVRSISKSDSGIRVHFDGGSEVFEKICLTTPSFVTAELLRAIDHNIHESLSQIHYSNVTQIYCEVVQREQRFDGFGFLVPSEEQMSLLGAVCVSNLFPQKTPDGRILFVLFVGGDRSYPFTATVDGALSEFNTIIKPAFMKVLHVQEWENAIPQFYVGHEKIIGKVKDFEKHTPNICIKGSYISGVAVGDVVS
jgi:oxygen-dependent protoporphyrinogen oxidase